MVRRSRDVETSLTTAVSLINGLLAEIDPHYQQAGKNKLAVLKMCSSEDMCAGCLKKVIHNLNCKVDYLHHRLYLAEEEKHQAEIFVSILSEELRRAKEELQDLKVPDSLS